LTPHGYNNQTRKYDIHVAVRYQTGWLKKVNIPAKYSQPVHKGMNKFKLILAYCLLPSSE